MEAAQRFKVGETERSTIAPCAGLILERSGAWSRQVDVSPENDGSLKLEYDGGFGGLARIVRHDASNQADHYSTTSSVLLLPSP